VCEQLTSFFFVLDFGLAVVEQEELESVFLEVSFVQNITVDLLVVAQSMIQVVGNELAELGTPIWHWNCPRRRSFRRLGGAQVLFSLWYAPAMARGSGLYVCAEGQVL
jgi:hypothetical protein